MKNALRVAIVAGVVIVAAAWSASSASARPPERLGDAAELDLPLTRCSVQSVEPVWRPDGSALVSVALPTGAATMELRPHSIRADGFSAAERRGNVLVPVNDAGGTTFRGTLLEDPTAAVIASIFEGQVTASIYFGDDRDPWCVQALTQFDGHAGAARDRHAVYRGSDAIRLPAWCGVDDRLHLGAAAAGEMVQRGPGTACQRIAEILFECDYEFYQAYGTVPATIAGLEAYINQVDFIYERDLGTSITTVQIIVTSEAPAVDHPYLVGADAYAILYGFRDYWATQAAPQRDNVHLMIARDTGGIAGLAYVGATCAGDGFNSGLSRRYTGDFNSIVVVLAHELGHNMGTGHDNQGGACANSPPGHIMSPAVNTSLMTFSPCTIININNYLWGGGGDCLQRVNPGVPFGRPDAGNGLRGVATFVDVLPNDLSCETMSLQLVGPLSVGGAALAISPGTGWAGTDRIEYTAALGTPNTDTFTYRAVNNSGASAPITVTMTNLTARTPENPSSTQPMLDVSYYALPSSTNALPNFPGLTPYATSTAATIDFPSTDGAFSDSTRADDVGAVYTGYLFAPVTGLYTLYTESDDGSRLLIGTTSVVNNNGLHGMEERSGQIALGAGWHALRVEFFERGGGAGLIMRWSGPGLSKQVIAAEYLKRDQLCPTDLDGSNTTDVPDIFQFLTWWFASDPRANWDGGPLDVADIFAYLTAWFAAVGPC